MEYSTISVLDYFIDTMANLGLPEAWLEWDSNDVAWIENTRAEIGSICIKKAESNIDKNHELNQVGNGESNQVGNRELKQVVNGEFSWVRNGGQSGTVDADYGANIRYLMHQ